MRTRRHNEYFRSVSAKRCDCGAQVKRLRYGKPYGTIEKVWSCGEYANAKWHTVLWFCEKCFERRVKEALLGHTNICGCVVELVGYHYEELPEWLTLEESKECVK